MKQALQYDSNIMTVKGIKKQDVIFCISCVGKGLKVQGVVEDRNDEHA